MKAIDRLAPFDPERFLAEYWQRKPCLIADWIAAEALTLDELMAAAAAHELPARLVSGRQDSANWSVEHGPLSADDLPEQSRDWTVLIQEMDKVHPGVTGVMEQFRNFLPDWALDDIMISQARPGGSVGAHVDAYDVFLLQVAGQRRWQIATHFDPTTDPHVELALLANWQPECELRVNPGEMLYLPAGVAHHGIAENDCQTWSIGLRTPSAPELMMYLAEELLTRDQAGPRLALTAPDRQQPARIGPDLLERTRTLLQQAVAADDETLSEMLASHLTCWRLWPADEAGDRSPDPIMARLGRGDRPALAASARLALIGPPGDDRLFVNGEPIPCPPAMARDLAIHRRIDDRWLAHSTALETLLECAALEGYPPD